MGKITHFKVYLLEDKEIYHAGEEVVGQLQVSLAQPMLMKCLRISFTGRAHVSWSEGSGDDKSSYWASQVFFNEETYVLGNGNSAVDETIELDVGSHSFPLRFTLPRQLPSTIEELGGYIRYYIKASIVRPWKFNHNTKKVFTVLDSLDLNTLPTALRPSGTSESKNFCCLCCISGPVELEFRVDRTGYVPGEWIAINATLNNASNRRIAKMAAVLYQKVTYHAQGRHQTLWRNVAKIDGEGCDPGATLTWENKCLQIPPLPPTEQVHCGILDVEYQVELVVHAPVLSTNLRGRVPVIIGTIPLRGLPQHIANNGSELTAGETIRTPPPSFSTLPPALPPNFSMLSMQSHSGPPPSYAAALEGTIDARDHDDNEFTMGEMEYTPHYLYYDWEHPASDFPADINDGVAQTL